MWKVVQLNFISFVMQQSCGEQIVFDEKERALGFSFYQLIDGLRSYNDTRLDEGGIVYQRQINLCIWFTERIHCYKKM
jgi:hypothetical protein